MVVEVDVNNSFGMEAWMIFGGTRLISKYLKEKTEVLRFAKGRSGIYERVCV